MYIYLCNRPVNLPVLESTGCVPYQHKVLVTLILEARRILNVQLQTIENFLDFIQIEFENISPQRS